MDFEKFKKDLRDGFRDTQQITLEVVYLILKMQLSKDDADRVTKTIQEHFAIKKHKQ